MSGHPRLSIGLPVYNGEKFVSQALDSILDQTFENFELIISDNASVDATGEICQKYAEKDNRIRYLRSEQNIGAAGNFNRTFDLANGEYFKWIAHDDVYDKHFLANCITVLDRAPDSVVLCTTRTSVIDYSGKIVKRFDFVPGCSRSITGKNIRELCFDEVIRLGRQHITEIIWGVMRTSALVKTRLFIPYHSGDLLLAAELSLLGKFWQVEDYMIFLREHPNRPPRSLKKENEWWGIRTSWFTVPPVLKLLYEYAKLIRTSKHSSRYKFHLYKQLHWLVSVPTIRRFARIGWKTRSLLTNFAISVSDITTLPLRLWGIVSHFKDAGERSVVKTLRVVWSMDRDSLLSSLISKKTRIREKP